MALQLIRSVPMLATGNMDKTIAFYRDLLGFELGDKFESSGEISWCEMRLGGAVLMFSQHETKTDAPGAGEVFAQTAIALYVRNVEEAHEELVRAGVNASSLRVTFYGMKEFDLRDPTGYTLLIGQATDESPTVDGEEGAPF